MRTILRDSVAIAFKELRQLSRDPVSLALTLMFPILLVTMIINIAAAFSAPSYDIPLAVGDLDRSTDSKILVEKLATSQVVRIVELCQSEDRSLSSVEQGSASGAVVIPKGFSNALVGSGQAVIILATDNSKIMSAILVRGAVEKSLQELLSEAGVTVRPRTSQIEVISKTVSGRPPSGDPILPGMLGIIIILGSFDDILNVVSRERERGTLPRLLLTPANTFSIYSGKILSTLILTFLRTLLMLVIFGLVGLVIQGALYLIFLTTSLIAFFTLSLGLVISSRIRSSATLTVLEIAFTFPLFQLAGAVDSPQTLAEGGKAIALSLPWTYGNEALKRVMFLGLGFDAVALNLLILLVSGFIMLPIALVLSERTM